MILYPFEDVKTGEGVELLMESKDAVEPGKVIQRDGRKLRRLISRIAPPKVQGDRFVNYQVARGTEQASGADHYEKGRPVFSSKRRMENWAATKTGEGIVEISVD